MKLYVGTYAKYNRGSIAGGWLNLDDYKNKAEFMKACRRLHKGERDPEFMFQDYEADADWESQFYSESHIDEDYWTVAAEERAKAAKEAAKPAAKLNPIRAEYAAALVQECAAWKLTREDAEKQARAAEVVVKLTGGQIIAFERLDIETRHCEGEDDGRGRSLKDAQAGCAYFKTKEGFKAINLDRVDSYTRDRDYYLLIPAYCGTTTYNPEVAKVYTIGYRHAAYDAHTVEITPEDWLRIDKAVEIARERFAARLDTYWARWGASKLHTWTYWTEA